MSIGRKFRFLKPACWKFSSTISHVLSPEYPEGEHLWRRQIRFESQSEITPHWLCPPVDIGLLHLVVHADPHRSHECCCRPGTDYFKSENAIISLAAR